MADLYLSWLEYKFLNKLIKRKDFGLVDKLKYNCWYSDDIATSNVDNFKNIASDIYPQEIPLEQSRNNDLYDTFLDLDITIVDSRFCFKIFPKTDLFHFEVIFFPFLESNIYPITYVTTPFFLNLSDLLIFVLIFLVLLKEYFHEFLPLCFATCDSLICPNSHTHIYI